MTFLKTVDVSRMFIKDGNRIFSLAPYQLLEILNFQSNKPFNDKWLFTKTKKPYFLHNINNKEIKKYILYLADNN